MKHSRCQDLAIGVVACLMMIRVDAFLAASSNGLSQAQRSHQITATSRRRAPYLTVTMRSTTRQSNGKGVPPAREEGKRRTPQEIAGDLDGQSFLSLAIDVVSNTGVRTGAIRSSQAARATASTAIDVALNVLGGVRDGTGPVETLKKSPPSVLRKLCERMGATYVKVGQFIASSPTLFPADYVKEFQKCLDKTDNIPWSTMRPIIEKDLGKRVTEVFSSINTVPLASASIAQVYAATLKTGEDVVIKVQKPGVAEVLKTDLGFMYITSKLVELVNPMFASRLSVSDIVGDIRSSMLDELDFKKEAANQEIFRAFLKESGIDHEVTAPKVFPEASTERVLTMERLYGVPLTDLEGIQKVSQNPEATLISALNTWTLSVMNCDFFHADVHAGNLLVLEDGRVAFIDFGIVGRFSPDTWTGVSRLADGVADEDFNVMAEALCEMGATVGPVDTAKFALDLEGLWTRFNSLDPEAMLAASGGAASDTSGSSSGSSTRLDEKAEQEATGFLLDLVSVSRENGLKLPREFGLLIKQQLYFDRYTKILAPTLDPLRDSRMQMKMKDQEGGVASGEDVLVLETKKGAGKSDTAEGEIKRLADVGEVEDGTSGDIDGDGRDEAGQGAQKNAAQDVGN
ncbi:unnamed protein product [Ectocarpus sp. CCAP 1310/34]|nr:unnamed protein product [Ectocarpus sp. CCAP 1310/34]